MAWFGQSIAGVAVRSSATPLLLGVRWAMARRGGAHQHLPTARWNIGLASKAALDEVFFASEFVLADLATRSAAHTPYGGCVTM